MDPLLFLEPTFSRYCNAIVGLMMAFLVRSSKIRDLQHWGRIICSKISSMDVGLKIVLKFKNTSRPEDCLKTKKYVEVE